MHVFSHKGTITNEIADVLANTGRNWAIEYIEKNAYQLKHFENWRSIGIKAVKNEIKKIVKYRTERKWINFRDSEDRQFSAHLSDIELIANKWFIDERKSLNIQQYSIINQLRCQHIKLNYYKKKKT
eukprot:551911_1